MDLISIREKVAPICRKNGLAMLGVFGSAARGEETPESDIDIVVRFKNPVSLIDLIRLGDDLEKTLGRPVDLGTDDSLHPLIRDSVMADLRIVYEG